MNSNRFEQGANEMENRFLDEVNRIGLEAASKEPEDLYFTIKYGSVDQPKMLSLSDEKLVEAVTSGMWAELISTLEEPVSAAVGIVRALVKCRAVFKEAHHIKGDLAVVFDFFLRNGGSQTSFSLEHVSSELDLSPRDVGPNCKKLVTWGLLSPEGDKFSLVERFYLRIPEITAPVTGTEDGPGAEIEEDP